MNSAQVVFLVLGSVAYFSSLAAISVVWMLWCRRFDHFAVYVALGAGVPIITIYPSAVMFGSLIG